MVKRTYSVSGVTGAEGTCLEKLRDTIALLASEWNFKEVPARVDRDCLNYLLYLKPVVARKCISVVDLLCIKVKNPCRYIHVLFAD